MSTVPCASGKRCLFDRNVGTLFKCHPENGALECFSRTLAWWFKHQKHKSAFKPVMIGKPGGGDQLPEIMLKEHTGATKIRGRPRIRSHMVPLIKHLLLEISKKCDVCV